MSFSTLLTSLLCAQACRHSSPPATHAHMTWNIRHTARHYRTRYIKNNVALSCTEGIATTYLHARNTERGTETQTQTQTQTDTETEQNRESTKEQSCLLTMEHTTTSWAATGVISKKSVSSIKVCCMYVEEKYVKHEWNMCRRWEHHTLHIARSHTCMSCSHARYMSNTRPKEHMSTCELMSMARTVKPGYFCSWVLMAPTSSVLSLDMAFPCGYTPSLLRTIETHTDR